MRFARKENRVKRVFGTWWRAQEDVFFGAKTKHLSTVTSTARDRIVCNVNIDDDDDEQSSEQRRET